MRSILLTTSVLLTALLSAADYHYDFTEDARATYDLLFALELDRAEEEIRILRATDERNLAADHLESYLDLFRLYLTGDEATDDILEERYLARGDRLERGDESDPWYRYVLAENRLHRSMVQLRFERHLAAFRELNRAHKLLRDNAEAFPEFLLTYKDLGLIHAAVGAIPPQYQWGVSFFSSLNGTIEQGRKEMLRARSPEQALFGTETAILQSLVDLHLAGEAEAAYQQVQALGLTPNTNKLHAFVLATLAMRSGRNDEAIRTLKAAPRSGTATDFPYLDFLNGQCRLRRLETGSRVYFQSFLLRYRGRHFREEALQKIAWSYLLEGDRSAYVATLERIDGRSRAGGDENAAREAAIGAAPHPQLLRARLLFDGGYGARARAQLQRLDPATLTERETLEFYYRRGRVAELLDEPDTALAYYGTTIDRGRDDPAFYACKAALQSGLIEERRGRTERAIGHFEDCLRISPGEYRAGLHSLAKAGVSRLID